jgi:DNA-binding MarR family transcriptional regulator
MNHSVNFLGRLLRRAHLIASRRYRRYLSEFGFTPGEARLLISVIEAPGVSPSVLSASSDTDPPTVTGTIERLIARGYLRREADPRDRRRLLLYATPAGEALLPRIQAARRASEQELEALLGTGEADQLRAILTRMLEADARASAAVRDPVSDPGAPAS